MGPHDHEIIRCVVEQYNGSWGLRTLLSLALNFKQNETHNTIAKQRLSLSLFLLLVLDEMRLLLQSMIEKARQVFVERGRERNLGLGFGLW